MTDPNPQPVGPIQVSEPGPGLATDIPEPELPILQQRPQPIYPAVDVKVVAPVQTQAQPATQNSIRFETIAASDPNGANRLLNRDLRRARAVILFSAAVFLGDRQGKIRANAAIQGAPWPQNVPLEIRSSGELWAYSTSATNATIIEEFYAD